MKNVRIFGVPAECVAKDEVKETLSLWSNLSSRKESDANLDEKLPVHVEDVVQPVPDVEVPSDFLDALTHIRMDVPMVLPCGQVTHLKFDIFYLTPSILNLYRGYKKKSKTWGGSNKIL